MERKSSDIPGDGRFIVFRHHDQISAAPVDGHLLSFEGEARAASVGLVKVDGVLSADDELVFQRRIGRRRAVGLATVFVQNLLVVFVPFDAEGERHDVMMGDGENYEHLGSLFEAESGDGIGIFVNDLRKNVILGSIVYDIRHSSTFDAEVAIYINWRIETREYTLGLDVRSFVTSPLNNTMVPS